MKGKLRGNGERVPEFRLSSTPTRENRRLGAPGRPWIQARTPDSSG